MMKKKNQMFFFLFKIHPLTYHKAHLDAEEEFFFSHSTRVFEKGNEFETIFC